MGRPGEFASGSSNVYRSLHTRCFHREIYMTLALAAFRNLPSNVAFFLICRDVIKLDFYGRREHRAPREKLVLEFLQTPRIRECPARKEYARSLKTSRVTKPSKIL